MDSDAVGLACETIVFRALTRASDFDKATRKIKLTAFFRRPGDKKGLSVDYNCKPQDAGLVLSGRKGVASLHVGWVRTIEGLDVEPDPETPDHGNITGVPFRDDPDLQERVEQVAGDLADQARLAHLF